MQGLQQDKKRAQSAVPKVPDPRFDQDRERAQQQLDLMYLEIVQQIRKEFFKLPMSIAVN